MGDKASLRRLCVVLACALLAVGISRLTWPRQDWKMTIHKGRREWVKGFVTHSDTNGDGLVDEESVSDPKNGKQTVRRDTDQDGYFDVEYNLSQTGLATNLSTIRKPVPRH